MHLSIPCNSRPGRGSETCRTGSRRKHALKPVTTALPRRMRRGHNYQTSDGLFGLYVGTTPSGHHWFSFKGGTDFAQLCSAFDSRWPPSHERSSDGGRRRVAAVA